MSVIKQGDTVRFCDSVVARSGHDYVTANMRGTVVSIVNDYVVRVETHGTYLSEDGRSLRAIPVANLERVKS